MVSQMLWWTPQYAYVEGKAIDEAVSRVARDCSLARDVPGRAIALYTTSAEALLQTFVQVEFN